MTTNFNVDPLMLGRFREEADTHLLTLQQDLVSLEQDPANEELLKEMFRSAHTVKGSAQMMGFRPIVQVMHCVEDIIRAIQTGKLSVSQIETDLLFEALDVVDIMTKAQVNQQELPLDPQKLIAELEQVLLLTGEDTPTAEGGNGAHPDMVVGTIGVGPAAPPLDDRLRVSIERLDSLMQLAGEMVISQMQSERAVEEVRAVRNAMRQRGQQATLLRERVSREWGNLRQSELEDELARMMEIDIAIEDINKSSLRSMEEFHATLETITAELQETVLDLRMTPVETIFRQFARSVRDLAKERGKQVSLVTSGDETELDKKVLEGLNEALIHLVRNALDHGIEPAEQRLQKGKPALGQITIRAGYQGGQAVVEVSDDGAGIDPARIKQLAVQRGIINPNEAERMSDEDARQLIFYSGFSTAQLITDTSGRGVGMEIVQRVISKLGGNVELRSEVGQGTTVILRLPISLSAIRALLVRAHNQVFAIATNALEDLAYIGLDDIINFEGHEAISVRERTVPLFRLDEILELGHSRTEYLNRRREEVYEQEYANEFSDFTDSSLRTDGGAAGAIKAQIKRLEDEDNSRSKSNGQHQITASAMNAALYNQVFAIRLEGKLPVAVLHSAERYVALLVDELVDEREIVVKRLSAIFSRIDTVAGTTVLGDGSIVVILDGPALLNLTRTRATRVRGAQPGVATGWRQELERPHPTLLVVDDSVTTRELERSILEAAGYKVEIAVDGVEALEMLGRRRYDLAIVDVEMPRMDGFTLTEHIKAKPDLDLPVIIVSSLANEEYKRRGIEVGAQAYITKGQFDQNNLLDTIELLIAR